MLIIGWFLMVSLMLALIIVTSTVVLRLKTTGIALELNFVGGLRLLRKKITFRQMKILGDHLPGVTEQIEMIFSQFMPKSVWEQLWLVGRMGSIAEEFRQRVHCTSFKLRVEVGVVDPALTGISVGLIYFCQGLLLQALYSFVQVDFKVYQFEVAPRFDRQIFSVDLDCIFTISIANIIIIGFKNLRNLIKSAVMFQPWLRRL